MKFNKSRIVLLMALCSLQFFYVFSGINFANRNLYFSLAQPNSRMLITNPANILGWKKQQIMKTSAPNTTFLQNNQVWQTTGDQFAPEETFEFADNLKIPDGQIVELPVNAVIDGKGHDLILGRYAQLVVDHSATVTFKNMMIKNTLNTISCPPIRCAGWYSQACFENVTFAFNNDWAFRDGQFFVHNDVEFTGTSKFSYRSVRPSYITSDANFIFSPNTTFEYYPSTTDNALIKMVDKTSSIIFDGSTLQSTSTGIRLTNGSLYFDNKVTLSSMDNTLLATTGAGINVDSNTPSTISVAWSPDGRYLVLANNAQASTFYSFNGSAFTFLGNVDSSAPTSSVAWSPDGKYLVLGNAGVSSKFYSFNGSSFTPLGNVDGTTYNTYSVAWSPDGKYLVLGNKGELSTFYSFNGSSFTLLGNVDAAYTVYDTRSVAWSPDGKYLVLGNDGQSSTFYSFNGSSFTLLGNVDGTAYSTFSVAWSPDGKYLVLGNNSPDLSTVYRFNGTSFTLLGNVDNTAYRLVAWSPDGKYLILANPFKSNKLYGFDGSSFAFLGNIDSTYFSYAVAWSPDGKYLVVGNFGQISKAYPVTYTFDISPQGFSNGIAFGNSAVGSSEDLNVYAQAAARVGIYGKVWQDSVNNAWNFQSRDSYVSLDRYDSQFRITNASTVQNWKKDQIIKSSAPNTFFLQNNQIWTTGINQLAPEETFELMNDLIIPDGQLTQFPVNGVIDGQGHDLILGKYAQLLVDGGVTVTFKNMTIKNTLNTISCPPIRCMDWYSQACFDNVTFAFNNDWAFRNGEFFIHNDVEFTGTSKFSYRSVLPSYITSDANFIFSPNTTFEYYPSTAANSLIKMTDKTSSIIFDGSTLQSTSTGIRLAQGSLYFDDKVTLSSMDNTMLTTLSYPPISQDYGNTTQSVSWSPDGRFLAIGGNLPTSGNELQVYQFTGSGLNLVASKFLGSGILSVSWSPDGRYLAIGGTTVELQVYQFTGSSLNLVASQDYGASVDSVAWSPDGKYLAIGGSGPTSGNELQVYQFTGSSLNLVASQDYGNEIFSVSWRPDGKYLAIGGLTPTSGNELQVYQFTESSLNLVASQDYGNFVYSVSWSPDGKYLAIGGYLPISGNELQVYQLTGSSLNLVTSQDFAGIVYSISWSPDGRYLAIGGDDPVSRNELQIYQFTGSGLSLVASQSYGLYNIYSTSWSPDGRFLAIGGITLSTNDLVVCPILYGFDTSPQGFSNGISFGNSAIGATEDLNVYAQAAARVGIYGKVWQDSVNNAWNFQSRDSYVSLDRYDSQFRITNAATVQNWKKDQIIKSSAPNTFFLQNNQIWTTGINQLAPEETFELMNDLIIPDGQLTQFPVNGIIDGQGHDLVLGKYAQLLVDGGVTVTFKNMTIKNTLNTISCPPIRCMDWYSKACFDNVTFAFNDDWAFRNGEFFIHNDVDFTGTSKFSYRSVLPSYITSDANFIFSPNTTFEYYPSTADNALIKMTDKTSSIIFDGSTLQSTSTGIRLAQGSLYFDNKVTLSSMDNTWLATTGAGIDVDITPYYTQSVAWSPDGRYFVLGNNGQSSTFYSFNGSSFTLLGNVASSTDNTRSVAWSPDGKYLVLGNQDQVSTFYSFSGSSFTLLGNVDSNAYTTYSVAWSPDGKYLVLGNVLQASKFYSFNGSSFTLLGNVDSNAYITVSVAWSPDGKYLVLGNQNQVSKFYSFNGSSFTSLGNVDSAKSTQSAAWSPDGRYLVLGNYGQASTLYRFNGSSFTLLGNVDSNAYNTYSVAWSSDGRYLVLGNSGQASTLYRFNGSSFTLLGNVDNTASTQPVAWSPDGKCLFLGNYVQISRAYTVTYAFDTSPQGYSNGIIFGNSALGASYDTDMYVLGGANVIVSGKLWYDDVN